MWIEFGAFNLSSYWFKVISIIQTADYKLYLLPERNNSSNVSWLAVTDGWQSLEACQAPHWIREKSGCETVCYASENGVAASEWECGEDAVNDKQTVGLKWHFNAILYWICRYFHRKKLNEISLLLTVMLHWESFTKNRGKFFDRSEAMNYLLIIQSN